eukprot:1144982-Pelagomonas_calceolata.AAC.3
MYACAHGLHTGEDLAPATATCTPHHRTRYRHVHTCEHACYCSNFGHANKGLALDADNMHPTIITCPHTQACLHSRVVHADEGLALDADNVHTAPHYCHARAWRPRLAMHTARPTTAAHPPQQLPRRTPRSTAARARPIGRAARSISSSRNRPSSSKLNHRTRPIGRAVRSISSGPNQPSSSELTQGADASMLVWRGSGMRSVAVTAAVSAAVRLQQSSSAQQCRHLSCSRSRCLSSGASPCQEENAAEVAAVVAAAVTG